MDAAMLQSIPGIGKSISEKIIEFTTTGKLKKLEDLQKTLPPLSKKEYLAKYHLIYKTIKEHVTKVSTYIAYDKKHGLVYDITPEWFLQNIKDQSCIYCGTREKIGCDRIDNDKGHTKDNCVPCCEECNYIRRDIYTVEEMKELGIVIKEIRANRSYRG